ncbi:MAG: hypothetical protein ABIR96_09655 [Bdellovibrionota bacterium]
MKVLSPSRIMVWGYLCALAACIQLRTPLTETTTPMPSPTPSVDVSVCSTQIVDAGQKGSVAAVARGLYSDTKIDPVSSNSATAFVDQSALSLKLVYWNGTRFVREIVSGDGNGAFVRLVFRSDGTPVVLWTLGISVKAAVRSAPLGTPGYWVAGVIDTGTAPRALEVSINPLNQISAVFLTDAAATGRAKYLYCDAPCASPSNFQAMAPNPYIENTNINVSETATGVAWCKSSASTYFPAAVYSVAGSVRYAVCRQSTLANCSLNTNWTAANVVATNNLSSKLWIDSTVTGDVPVVVTLGAAGIVPYRMGTTTCTLAPGAFTAGAAIGTSTSGNQWMSLMKDGLGKFHLVANEGTTGVKYYNSTTTDAVAAWNPGAAVETTALAAAHGGGGDINIAKSSLFMSYPTNVAPFDLKLARVNDYSMLPSATTYSRFVPDLSGNVQLGTAGQQLKNIAAASTSQKIPALAYVDYSIGAVAGAKLKFALRSGAHSDSSWASVFIPGTINPMFPSLIFDAFDSPWISYYDSGTTRFYLTTNSKTDGSGNWSTYEFPATPAGVPIALPAANNTALALRSVGDVSNPVMIVVDTNATSKGVKASLFNATTQTWSTVAVVDPLVGGALGAAHLTASQDNSGNVVVAFQDLSLTRVKYASSANGTTWSSPISVSGIGQGVGAVIAVNPVDGKPSISYYDQPNNAVYYANCTTTIPTCLSANWATQKIESAAGISTLTAATGQLLTTSLAFSPQGAPWVFYPRGQGNDGNLIRATNTSGSWVATIHASGTYGNLPGSAPLNFGVAGWNVVTSMNAGSGPVSSFIGSGNTLYSTSCGD